MEKNQLQNRNSSLDLLRITALLSVIAVHFFVNSGFYDEPVLGKRMFLMSAMRMFFMDCVPLFMMLTGYLMNRKTLSKHYYAGAVRTLSIYVLAGVACMLFRHFVMHEPLSFKQGILKILDFSAAPYAWYVEMYLGLFLLLPFLNLIYNGLKTKREKQLLLLTMLALTALPGVLNLYSKLIPNWWVQIYPITYYFLGCYLCEFQVQLRKSWNILLLLAQTLVLGGLGYHLSRGKAFAWGAWQDSGSLVNLITTLLVFLFIVNIHSENWSLRVKSVLKYLSGLCLGAYLSSYIFDKLLYPCLNTAVPVMRDRIFWFVPVVLAVALGAFALSAVLNFLYDGLHCLLHFKSRRKKK